MRRLKFRAWHKGKMHNDFTFGDDSVNHGFKTSVITIMQYTGLKDKNGVEIYEGDIVKDGILVGTVEYISGCFYLVVNKLIGVMQPLYLVMYGEVIGNIYENKDLLNG